MKSRWIPLALVAVPMAVSLTLGLIWGFPVFDDAYLLRALREGSVGDLAAHHPDRPLYGALIEVAARTFGRAETPYVILAVGCWALLAWQVHRLWRRLFPERAELSVLAAALAASPL